jgi:hypothetical protein
MESPSLNRRPSASPPASFKMRISDPPVFYVRLRRSAVCRIDVVKLVISVLVTALASSLVFADDFKTNTGKEYKNVTISRVEPDGIVVITDSGIVKLYFTELPQAVRDKFHYDEAKAAAFASTEAERQRAI